MRLSLHLAASSLAFSTLLATACGEEGDREDGGAGTGASDGSAGQAGPSGGSAGSVAGKGGSASSTAGQGGGSSAAGKGGTSGGSGAAGVSAGASGSGGSGGSDNGNAGAATGGSGAKPGMNDCDPRKILCRRTAPVCDEGEAPSVEGICYGPCVPISSCACNSAEACPLPDMFTCHLSRARCDYYVR